MPAGELFRKNRERLLRVRPSETLTRLPLDRAEPLVSTFTKSNSPIKQNLMETITDK